MVVNAGSRPSILMLGTDRYPMQACLAHGIDAVVVCGPAGRDNGYVAVPDGLRALPVDNLRAWQQRNWPEANFSDRLWIESGRAG